MNYNLTLKTPPETEPLTFTEAKRHLKLDTEDTFEDDDITSLITTARGYCEDYQNRAYLTQTWQLSFDYWPSGMLELPKGSLQTIDSVAYKDSSGVTTELTEGIDYVYSTRGILGRLTPAYDKSWPSFTPFPLDAIVIEFTCGYGDLSSDVPEKVKLAMKLLIGHWYENREAASTAGVSKLSKEIEFSVHSLLNLERLVPV
ncbi:MAG: head-tail connector protein [Desulfosporosinus sp.]